ncbi:hypothetical protein D3C87_1870330 [compost metagenome]
MSGNYSANGACNPCCGKRHEREHAPCQRIERWKEQFIQKERGNDAEYEKVIPLDRCSNQRRRNNDPSAPRIRRQSDACVELTAYLEFTCSHVCLL